MTILFILLLKQGRQSVNECKGADFILSKARRPHHRREKFCNFDLWNGLKQNAIFRISSRNKTLLLTITYSTGPGFIFNIFHSKDLFIMLEIPIFKWSIPKYRLFNVKIPKNQQIMREFPVTHRKWNTVMPYIFPQNTAIPDQKRTGKV